MSDHCSETQCFDKEENLIVERAENTIGSYAVYHKTIQGHIEGNLNHETGKVFHIYRPKAIDAEGKEAWGTLSYENGSLTVTIPQEFLDSASYPVRVDPTFGNTSIGASSAIYAGRRATSFTSPTESGSITSISAYTRCTVGTCQLGTALYSNASSSPDTRLAVDSGNATFSTPAWNTTNISYTYATNTTLWLASWIGYTAIGAEV